jgi:hypothetical protein
VECGKRSKQTIRHRGCRALDAVCPPPPPPGACRWLQPLFSSGGPDLIASWFVIARCKQTSKKKKHVLLRPNRYSAALHHRQEIVRQFQPPFHTRTPFPSVSIPGLRLLLPPAPCGVRPCSAGRCSAHVFTFKRLPLALTATVVTGKEDVLLSPWMNRLLLLSPQLSRFSFPSRSQIHAGRRPLTCCCWLRRPQAKVLLFCLLFYLHLPPPTFCQALTIC